MHLSMIRHADPDAPVAQACLIAYTDVLASRIPGFNRCHVPVPDPKAALYRPPLGVFLVALSPAGDPLGCVSLKRLAEGDPATGEVKRLWVAKAARGQGLAHRLMQAIEAEARALGMTRLCLDTNEALTEAITFYQRSGWTPIPAYTGPPATHWFAKPL